MLNNRSCPAATVIPELPYRDVREAARWLRDAFGFSVRLAIGNHRVQMNVGDGESGAVVCVEGGNAPLPRCSVMVRVDDVDAHYRRAFAGGARVSGEPVTFPYGERQYCAEDPAGHRWCFTQSVADVDPASWGGEASL